MKVVVWAWVGQSLPEGWKHGEEQEVTAERLVELFNAGFEVALMHTGSQLKPGVPILAIDEQGRKFRQR